MPEQNGRDGQGPTTAALVLRGILLLIAAFITASIIILAHAPLNR
jgi:hypothetical protein